MNDDSSGKPAGTALPANQPEKSGTSKFLRRLVRIAFGTALFSLILFGTAGRFNWPGAWTFAGIFSFFLVLVLVWGTRNAPELLDERSKVAGNVKSWDRTIIKIYNVLLIGLFILAGIDARFHWSHVAWFWQTAGGVVFVLAGTAIFWCMRTNAFLSARARIQDDRGHTVVQSGPYQYVRHPMYAGIMVMVFGVALLLGSKWALLPAGSIGILFVVRTALEDRMLRTELPGYEEYAGKVKYRLVVGVW
jgi:protein-S-isoprenylcysteine O-methyltransferase Ste14